ncbi:MAG: VanZ family protein [Acutalibacteraceae bacterium]
MKNVKILRMIILLLLAADMMVIFCLSAQKAEQSSETSSGVIEQIVRIIYKDFDSWSDAAKEEKIESFQHVVRKIAHMTEYASLGVLTCAFALTYGFDFKRLAFALLFCAFYAASDEFHQKFVEGRSCQFTDVLIDSTGALIGILVFTALTAIIVRVKHKKTRADLSARRTES